MYGWDLGRMIAGCFCDLTAGTETAPKAEPEGSYCPAPWVGCSAWAQLLVWKKDLAIREMEGYTASLEGS